jgi:hypothetical protein
MKAHKSVIFSTEVKNSVMLHFVFDLPKSSA